MQWNTICMILCKWTSAYSGWDSGAAFYPSSVFIKAGDKTSWTGTSCNVRIWCRISLNNLRGHHFVLFCILWCYLLKRDTLMHCLSTVSVNTVYICITITLFFFDFSASQPLNAPDSSRAAAELFCSHTHFHVILTCQCAQNCQTLLKALDAMCNSFNTRPCRYPYHCCNVVLMPPCILQACTRQLVIHLIYSTRPAVDQGAPRSRRLDGQNTAHGRTLSSICSSEVISGWFVIASGQRNITRKFQSAATDFAFMKKQYGNTWKNEWSIDQSCSGLWKGTCTDFIHSC